MEGVRTAINERERRRAEQRARDEAGAGVQRAEDNAGDAADDDQRCASGAIADDGRRATSDSGRRWAAGDRSTARVNCFSILSAFLQFYSL